MARPRNLVPIVAIFAPLAILGIYLAIICFRSAEPEPWVGPIGAPPIANKKPGRVEPKPVAPPFRPAPAALAQAWDFLYTGDKPRQTGVKKGVIDPRRAAVLHGRVLTRDGVGIPGANITIEGHPEFGGTLSQPDGSFALAANGGDQLCVHYHKEGLLPLCRQVPVPWQDHAWLADVALIPADIATKTESAGGRCSSRRARWWS
jgi:hypothetical protein